MPKNKENWRNCWFLRNKWENLLKKSEDAIYGKIAPPTEIDEPHFKL